MSKTIRKLGLILAMLMIFLIPSSLYATETQEYLFPENLEGISNNIKSIDTRARIDEHGDMYISQDWLFNDSETDGTEHFIPFNTANLNGVKLSNLKVYRNGQPMEKVEWDVDGMFEEKSGNYGVHFTDTDVEFCFGITQKTDNNLFTVEYMVQNAVEKTEDGDYFLHWTFVNDSLSSEVAKVRTTIETPNGAKKIFGFGYSGIFVYSSQYKDTVIMETYAGEDGLYRSNNRQIALVELNQAPFENARELNATTQEKYKTAFKGSNYKLSDLNANTEKVYDKDVKGKPVNEIEGYAVSENTNNTKEKHGFGLWSLLPMINFLIPIIFVGFGVLAYKKTKLIRGYKSFITAEEKKETYFREEPKDTTEEIIPFLMEEGLVEKGVGDEANIITYFFVKWFNQGQIRIFETEKKTLLGSKKVVEIDVSKPLEIEDAGEYERKLYNYFHNKFGSKPISDKMLKILDWAEIERFTTSILRIDEDEHNKYLQKEEKTSTITPEGREIVLQHFGLRNFLKDFTLMNERKIQEVKLWNYHLELATLYGIADEVYEQIKLHPDIVQTASGNVYNGDEYRTIMLLNALSHNISSGRNSYVQAQRSSGSGGSSSFGGGFGGSGGGSGGGTR